MNKEIGAYLIKDKLNNKFYTGSSGDLEKRIDRHISDLKHNVHKNKNLQEQYNSTPELKFYDRFNFIKIHAENKEKAIELEQRILDIHKDSSVLYNIATNAKVSSKGAVRSEEFRNRISEIHTGLKRTPEQIEKNRIGHLGIKQSEETKEKRRVSMMGKNLGKKHTPEAIEKISIASRGRCFSDETKAKISEASSRYDYNEDWAKKHKAAIVEKQGKKLMVDNVCYNTIGEAALANGLSNSSARDRANSTTGRFDNWLFV